MISFFRSEDVNFCNLIIPYEYCYEVVKSLGHFECVEFINKNEGIPTFNRQFTKHIIWCEEMQRKIRNIIELIKKDSSEYFDYIENNYFKLSDTPSQIEFNELEEQISTSLTELTLNSNSLNDLRKGYNELDEYFHVLRCTDQIYQREFMNREDVSNKNLRVITGIIAKSQLSQFENILWRLCKGNMLFNTFSNYKNFIDPSTKENICKTVFEVYLQSDQLVSKVKSICEAFRVSIYLIPISSEEKENIILGLLTRIKNIEVIINKTKEQRKVLLNQISRKIRNWKIHICEIKSIFTTLNMFQYEQRSMNLIAECWIPQIFIKEVIKILENIKIYHASSHTAILNVIEVNKKPPTYYRKNKLTEAFQILVDAYAVASYKEINPALFMIITFPFLFSVMFGDFGHGLFLLFTGLYLVLCEKELVNLKKSEMLSILYFGRYIILLMGLFSLYAGIIYNDAFSKSFYIFSSGWHLPAKETVENIRKGIKDTSKSNRSLIELDQKVSNFTTTPYPLGIDPIWMFAKNKIIFINSFKMKTSIILGFLHMLFGIILSAINNRYFYKNVEFYTEFLPQFIFYISLFGYLIFLIFYKWIFINAFSKHKPSILIVFINMFMNFGKSLPETEYMYLGQSILQPFLVIIALICFPWMLLSKPIYIILKKRNNSAIYYRLDTYSSSSTATYTSMMDEQYNQNHLDRNSVMSEEDIKEGTGELAIMQLIHTIEFCLGGISNIASYLRLWALSLAHGQLSELLWSMIFRRALTMDFRYASVVICFVTWIFVVFTISLLVLMEGLSTFLHALRLHWIEFQNKFYSGGGKSLQPFSLKKIVENHIYEDEFNILNK